MKPTATISTFARPWAIHLCALLIYTVLALLVTFPLPLYLGSQIIANGPGQVDGYLGIWNIWWAAQALISFQNPFVTPLLFHPQGLDLFWQTLSLPQGILALPITLTAGPLPAYNMLILLSFILGGYFTFLFVRAVLRRDTTCSTAPTVAQFGLPMAHSRRDENAALGARRHIAQVEHTDLAALIAGAIYAFAPFHMQKVLDAQLEVASIQWLPLCAWALLLLLERQRWYWAVLAALLLLWVGLGTWYYGLFALIYAGMAALLWAIIPAQPRPRFAWRTFAWGIAPLCIWLLIMAPRLISLARTGDELLGDARLEQDDAAADLIAFFLPNPNHPLWGEAVTNLYLGWYPSAILWNVSLGIVGTLLGILGLMVAWRVAWRWWLLGCAAAAIALGVELQIVGIHTGIPMPYDLLNDLPGIRSSHRPNHFVLVTILMTALMAGFGVRWLLQQRPRLALPGTTLALAAILLIDGIAAPLPLFARPMPQPYTAFAEPDGALLPVPLHLNFSNSENLWYQTEHRWPIIGGFIGREPPYPLARYAPGIREMRFGRAEPDDILRPGWPELARETLAAYEIRYIMHHYPAMGTTVPLMTELTLAMGLQASYQDDLIGVYPVPPPPTLRPLAYLRSGWGDLEQSNGVRWRWMGDSAEVMLLNPDAAPRRIALTLDLEAFAEARPLTLRLDDGPSFTIPISRERMRRTLHLILPPGETVLYLGAPAASPPDQPGRRLSLAVMGITIE